MSAACALLACLWLAPALAEGTPVPETPAARSAYDLLEQMMADTARVSREVELWNAKAKLEEAKTKTLKAEAENKKLASGGDAATTATVSAAAPAGRPAPPPADRRPGSGDDELKILDIRGPADDLEARVQAPGHPVQRIHGSRRGVAASEVPGFGKVVAIGPYCIQFDARKACFDDQAAPSHRLAADIPGMVLPVPAEPVIHLPGGRDVQIGAPPIITPVAPPRPAADPNAQRADAPPTRQGDRAEQGQDRTDPQQ